MIGSVEASQRRFLRPLALLAMLVPVVGYLTGIFDHVIAAVVAMGVLAGWTALQREFLRSVLLIYSRPPDMAYVAVLIPGAVFAVFGPKPASVWAVMALAIAAWIGTGVAHRMLAKDPGWVQSDATPFWREMRPLGIWSAVGAVIYWLFSQSYNYVLAGRLGLAAVANVNASRLLLMPTIVLTVGVKGLLIPSAAAWLSESGVGKLTRRLLVFIAGIALLDLFYFAFVWIFRDWLTGEFLHKTIVDRDRLLILWAGVSLVSLVRDILQSALLALERFKPMAWLTAAGAVIALSVMWFGIPHWGAAAALIGQVAGEFVNLVGIVFLLRQAHRYER
jgi:O-antigen/teichoic acid export membrane protein